MSDRDNSRLKKYTFAENKDFVLESGEKFGPIVVGYETFGKLNEDRSNAILIFHALTGDTHVTSCEDEGNPQKGWWDTFVGYDKSIDVNKQFIICANYFGGCSGSSGPSQIDPDTSKPFGLSFPIITVKDMVAVQKRLIDHLGIKKLKAIIGGSLGGMLALQWSILYPESVERIVIIASAARTSPQVIAFYEVGRNSIMADPNFNMGNYYASENPTRGLSIARMLAHITYLSKDSMEKKFGRDVKENVKETDKLYGFFGPMFQVESYLRYQGKKFVDRFDANSYMYITKAMDMFDITSNGRDLRDVLDVINSKMLVVSFTSDWHFPPSDSWEIVRAMLNLGKNISYVNLDTSYGHDSFLIPNTELGNSLKSFIENGGE